MGARRRPRRQAPAGPGPAGPAAKRLAVSARQHRAVLVDSLRRMVRRPVNALLTVGVIAIALALPAALYTGVKNLSALGEGWQALGDVSVYLHHDLDGTAAGVLAERLEARADVLETRLVSPEQAREAMVGVAGFGEALAALPGNPLPWVVVVRPGSREPAVLNALADELSNWPQVDMARFDLDWLERFRRLLELGRQVVTGVAALLGLALVLVVGNTIRLDIENRRREVEVTRLLGATDAFIRRPFLYAGWWYGLGGGLAALLLVRLLTAMLETPVARLADAYNSKFTLAGLGALEALGLVALGALIGWSGAWIAVSRQLAGIQPE